MKNKQKKVTTKKAQAKKPAPKKTVAKKTVRKSTSQAKKPVKTTSKKSAPKKTASKKPVAKKTKTTSNKTVAKKTITTPLRKNVSQHYPNGILIITTDDSLFGSDGKSKKVRMGTVVDSNRKDEIAIVKYTTSKKNGKKFSNSKGFDRHGNRIYTKDKDGKPIKIDNKKFSQGSKKRTITKKEANEIKRRNIKESKHKKANKVALRNLKGRKKK